MFKDFANNKTSVLIQDQVPEFVRNNYPQFVAFLEAYYEYLEQNGKQINALQNMPNYLDVDYVVENNLTDFVEVFRQTYLAGIPPTVLADKAKLIKHIKNFYVSRGTSKSFKFLFRVLFNQDVNIFTTGTQILKASDGKWYQPFVLRINSSNSASLWVNTQIFGQTSFASAIVETASIGVIPGATYTELTLSNASKIFLPNETIIANTGTATLYGTVLGIIPGITVINPGSKYNVGDPVIINGGGGANANAIISSVTPGNLLDLGVTYGGSGYQIYPNWQISVTGGGITGVNADIFAVDTSGALTPNSFPIIDDVITPSLNISLNTIFTNFTQSNININSRIVDAAKYIVYGNCGPILLAHIISGGQGLSRPPTINITEQILIGNSQTSLAALGAIGQFQIINSGHGYSVNDDIIVISTTSRGVSGAGKITSVNATGAITGTIVALPSITGYANVTLGSNIVAGNGTIFTKQLLANNDAINPGSGTYIVINGESHRVMNIISNTSCTVDTNYAANANNQVIRLDGYMLGGYGYKTSDFPTGVYTTIRSIGGGSGATILPHGILGADATLIPVGQLYGQIQTIQMITFGDHYSSQPTINLTQSGDGTAVGIAQLIAGNFQKPGYFLNEDGMLSARRYLEDAFTYNKYSYQVISPAFVTAYEQIVNQILNPVGSNMIGITRILMSTQQRDIYANAGITITTSVPTLDLNFLLDFSILS